MNSFIPAEIAATGLNAQRLRMVAIASNLANVNTTRTNGVSAPYQRRDVIFTAQEIEPFAGLLGREMRSTRTAADLKVLRMSQGVTTETVVDSQSAPRPVYDPEHPDANDQGYVLYPNVSIVKEMADMIAASHSYEANMAVLQTSVQMVERSLRLTS